MSKQPEFKNKYVTVWDSQYGLNLVVEKSYKDKKTNEWKKSSKFFMNEAPALIEAIKEALQHFDSVDKVKNAFDDGGVPF